MKKIVSNNTPQIGIEKITNQMHVGLIKDGEKYLVVNKLTNGRYSFSRMNDSLIVLQDSYEFIRILLEKTPYEEAFVFDSKEEMFNWLLL